MRRGIVERRRLLVVDTPGEIDKGPGEIQKILQLTILHHWLDHRRGFPISIFIFGLGSVFLQSPSVFATTSPIESPANGETNERGSSREERKEPTGIFRIPLVSVRT